MAKDAISFFESLALMKSKAVIDKHRFILIYSLGFVSPYGLKSALILLLQVLIFFSILPLLTLSDFDLPTRYKGFPGGVVAKNTPA